MDRAKLAVLNALRSVIDPEVGLDLVAMGLVYGVSVTDAEARVTLTLTTQGCPMGQSILGMAYEAVATAAQGRKVDLQLAWSPPWDPRMIDEDSRRALGGPF